VLRLLPERLYAGLFGHSAWLSQGAAGQQLPAPANLPTGATPSELLDTLLNNAPPRRRAAKLSIMLPSQSARCVSLPWSEDLRTEEELQAYALAHFEMAGLGTFDDNVVHAAFRHYGAKGFAYAVPKQLIGDLYAVAVRHDLELTTAIPIGGVAHLAAKRTRGKGSELSVIVEDASVSALVMDGKGLQHYDVEPVVCGPGATLRRLLTRVTANSTDIAGITLCADRDEDSHAEIAGASVPKAVMRGVKSAAWRRHV